MTTPYPFLNRTNTVGPGAILQAADPVRGIGHDTRILKEVGLDGI